MRLVALNEDHAAQATSVTKNKSAAGYLNGLSEVEANRIGALAFLLSLRNRLSPGS
jgi:hypothetical protein